MLIAFDHLIFLTHDLDVTAAAFERLGFAITERDDLEPGATENKLVVFVDGSYIEIVRFADPAMLPKHRFKALAETGGWAEAVIRVDDLAAHLDALVAADVPISPLRVVRKDLRSGETWEVAMSHLGRGVASPLMPMLAEDRSPHALRVPDYATVHPNGAKSVRSVTMVSQDGAPAGYEVLFPGQTGPDFGFGEGRRVHLARPGDHMGHLAARGDGIVSIEVSLADGQTLTLSADDVLGLTV
ncbi:MAG: VOC family protein [Pseudomonadota bacterium]|nr:VOC family protein [Pseudomonadota bacterium]